MTTKNTLSWLLLLFGEGIIITAFILFKGETPTDILVLNIAAGSLVYGLFAFNFRTPWINLKDKSQKQVGALGINWLTTWSYAVFAAGLIATGYFVPELTFAIQLFIHLAFLFFLFLWLLLSRHSADKAAEVYMQETQNYNGINDMKSAMRRLKDKMNDLPELPGSFTNRINSLEEGLRFISPANNEEAYNLERSFTNTLGDISSAIPSYSMNEAEIENNLKNLERIYQNRKNIYSN
jgi:hypothetical protein